ncbi:MAG TPA: response regulator transcription factor [Thermopolyspora sp.]|jgi:Response regulators consisting of a CheY-like receiver domain and a winged-helix DNA-binding domain
MRVLVVADEDRLAALIAASLRGNGMAVEIVHDADEALCRMGRRGYDLIVLDGDPPLPRGDEICGGTAPGRPHSPVLVLTKADDVMARIDALSLGADDCLAKPLAVPELLARVRALTRRARSR